MRRREFALFVMPSAVLMAVLMIGPLVYTFYLSLQHLTFGSVPHFVGFQNYLDIFHERETWDAVWFTLIYVFGILPVHTSIGLVLALMLERVGNRMRAVLIPAYAMPFIFTPVVGTLVFSWLFKDHWGILPYLLAKIDIHVHWFIGVWPARIMVMLWGIWWSFGFDVMVLCAGLQTLPREQVQAAIVDGAGYWQRLRHIVLPHLMPYLLLITLFNVIDGLRVFSSVWVTESIAYLTYRVSFALRELGAGSALSMLSMVVTLLLVVPLLYARSRQSAQDR
jgi:multiple sugar transport system permease protein